jgi:tRNA-specific 2-thiouridylase
LRAIKSGLTPNPDILCNKFVKFNHFVKYVEKEFSTNLISTGHYAKVEKKGENFYLRKPKDRKKDQTYFLCKVDRKILSRVIFPINDLEKKTVREIAFINKLSNHQKKDSTGICFIGENKFEKFISNYIKPELGDIIEIESGKKIGSHNGYFLFTIGQRKGLGISGLKSPRYVVGKNPEKNLVYVSSG